MFSREKPRTEVGDKMVRKVFLQSLLVVTLFHLASTAYANVNVQVIPYANGCKGAVIYNNSNHVLEITVSYIYEGRDGSYFSSSMTPIAVQPRASWTHPWLPSQTVDCSKPYTVRTNYTYVDKTVQAQQEAENQRRQAEAERKRQDQFQRDQKRRNDDAEAARKKRNEEFLREREARLKKEREARERAIERARNQPGIDLGCPPGKHCKPLHLPPPSNPNQDTSARVHTTCLGITRTSERSLRECRQIEAKIRLENEQREASEAAAAAETRRRREAEERRKDEAAARARDIDAEGQRMRANPCSYADEQVRSLQPPPPSQNTAQSMQSVGVYNQRVGWLSSVVQMCSDRDPCAGAEIFARRGPAQMQTSTNAAWQKGIAEWNAKAKADFQPTLDRLRSACTAARNPARAGQAPPTSPGPYSAQSSTAPATQTTDPCEHTRKAYENDPKNLVKAYLLKRCIRKNR